MMPKVAYILSDDFISLTINGAPTTLYKNDARFAEVKNVIKSGCFDRLDEILNLPKAIVKFSLGQIQVFDGEVRYKDAPVNNTVVDRILLFLKEGFPFEPLVKFLDRLMLNPNAHSRDQLYSYLELYKLPITDEGKFYAMKAVTPAYKDKYTNSFDNLPGSYLEMARQDCDLDPDVACGPAFHCGNLDYIKWFGGADDKVVLVEVDPKDVVSCPHDHSYQKLRVCAYEVVKDLGFVRDIIPFDKEYAPQTNHIGDQYMKLESAPKLRKGKWNIVSPNKGICRKNMATRAVAIQSMLKQFKGKSWDQLYKKGYRAVQVV